MKIDLLRYLGRMTVVVLLLLATGSTLLVSAAEGDKVEFTNVADGDVLSELTILTGTIEFPEFLKYEIFLKSGNNLIWAGNSHSPVQDGNLFRLDPRVFVSGVYQLIVRQVHKDSNYADVPGPTITIENPYGTPLPYYPEVEPSFLYPSQEFAVVRVRNCTGEDFNFDYHSPEDFRSSGDEMLAGKVNGSICVFRDLALIPGEYRGTAQGGGQSFGAPFEVLLDSGKVYQWIYHGPGAGGDQIIAQETAPDDMHGTGPAAQATQAPTLTPPPAPTATPTPAAAAAAVEPATPVPDVSSQAETPPETQAETVLPTTGNEAKTNILSIIIALMVIFLLGTGGVLAIRSRRYS